MPGEVSVDASSITTMSMISPFASIAIRGARHRSIMVAALYIGMMTEIVGLRALAATFTFSQAGCAMCLALRRLSSSTRTRRDTRRRSTAPGLAIPRERF